MMNIIEFMVVKGHQVASGLANDPNFPQGTISAQLPLFEKLGFKHSQPLYHGTINAKFNCGSVTINHSDYCFKQIKWHSLIPAEDFSLCKCKILSNQFTYNAFIYQPHLETKVAHFQPANQLELIAPFIHNIGYGSILSLAYKKGSLTIT